MGEIDEKDVIFELYFFKEDSFNFKTKQLKEDQLKKQNSYNKLLKFMEQHFSEELTEEVFEYIDNYTSEIETINYHSEKHLYKAGFLDGLSVALSYVKN